MRKDSRIQIIGAGLCGALLALRLGQRGYQVEVYEKRPDLRKVDISAGRSINLAFSDRGIKAMKLVGLTQKVASLCIPMNGRMLHDTEGNTVFAAYSGRSHEYINSISRGELNALLLDEAEALTNVQLFFNHKCTAVDFEKGASHLYHYPTKKELVIEADCIFGTDGAGSSMRKSYYLGKKFLFSFSQDYLSHGYKELSILPGANGAYKAYKNALHIWGRGDFMLIALPNLDGSFTVTLFLSYTEGEYNFSNLTTPEKVIEFFEKYFKDALALMPHLPEEFFKNPTSPLGTVKCSPWHYRGKTLLMGDAAHAIVPFYGQGMNASFEDVVEFDTVLNEADENTSWETIFNRFETTRKKDTDAIADLAVDNFHEMKGHVNQPIFREKRTLETALEKHFPTQYASKYSLVTFNEDIGYAAALELGRAQDKALLNLIADHDIVTHEDMSIEELKIVLAKVREATEEILTEDRVSKLGQKEG